MALWNLGSVAAAVLDLVEDVPTAISGTRLLEIADQKRYFMEQFTGLPIGSVDIAAVYQGPLVDFTSAATLDMMMLQGADVSNLRLGDFSVSKGAGGNLAVAARNIEAQGMRSLKAIGKSIRSYKVEG